MADSRWNSPSKSGFTGRRPRRCRASDTPAEGCAGAIDHLGYGIERMNRSQAERYLPLPDYDLSEPGPVKLTIYGSVVDESYTRMLMRNSKLPLEDVLAPDRVRKGIPISDTALRRLRRKGLVEGRRPHVRVAASIAEIAGTRASHVESRGKSEECCQALVTDYLRKHGTASRLELNETVFPSLSSELTDSQKNTTRAAICSPRCSRVTAPRRA